MVLIVAIVIRVGPHARHIRLTMLQHASPHPDKDLAFRKRQTVGRGTTEGFCANVRHFSPSKTSNLGQITGHQHNVVTEPAIRCTKSLGGPVGHESIADGGFSWDNTKIRKL